MACGDGGRRTNEERASRTKSKMARALGNERLLVYQFKAHYRNVTEKYYRSGIGTVSGRYRGAIVENDHYRGTI